MLFKNYTELISNGQTPALQQKRKDILDILTAAVESVDPYLIVEHVFDHRTLVFPSETIDLSSFDHIYVVGIGKASVRMTQAVCDAVNIEQGVVITNDSTAALQHKNIKVIVGGHPLPNEGSILGADALLQLLSIVGENDCVIVCISGGGSALCCKPRAPLLDLKKTTDLLLRSGATIEELNTIRKHLSYIKGGQLVHYCKGVMISLILSDIINDPVSSIASGPTAPDPTTFFDAKAILDRYQLWDVLPQTVRTIISNGVAGKLVDTPKEDDPVFHSVLNFIIANNDIACQAAAKKAKELGYHAKIITTYLAGDARSLGPFLVKKASQSIRKRKTAFITGGETTVDVQGRGSGGRNQELVLSCVQSI